MRSRNMALQAYLELAPPGSVCRETCRAGERRSCHCASHAAASSVGGGQRVLLPPQQAPPQIELRLALQRDRREELRSPGRTSQSENFADRDRPTYLHPGFRVPPRSLRTRVLDHPAQGARGQGIMPGPTGTPCRSDQFPRPHCTLRHPPPPPRLRITFRTPLPSDPSRAPFPPHPLPSFPAVCRLPPTGCDQAARVCRHGMARRTRAPFPPRPLPSFPAACRLPPTGCDQAARACRHGMARRMRVLPEHAGASEGETAQGRSSDAGRRAHGASAAGRSLIFPPCWPPEGANREPRSAP